MTTMKDVFDLTMGLIDEVNENSGETDSTDTREYKTRTPLILQVLRGELYPISDTYAIATNGKRPICPPLPSFKEDATLGTEIGLDDFICQTILPYGLAAHLLLTEDSASAAFFNQRYQELIAQFRSSIPTGFEAIENVYGYGNEHGEYSRW